MKGLLQKLIACSEIVQPLVPFLFTGDAIQAFTALSRFEGGTLPAARILQLAFYIGVCVLSVVAGVQLLRARPSGLRLSILVQALQVPVINSTAFSYVVKFICGVWVFCRFDTGFVGFHASLIDNIEFALIFHGEPVAPELEINLLAVAIIVCLLRALRRQRPGYVEKPKPPLPRRLWRFAWRATLVLLALVSFPLLALWIYNRTDEKPTAAAERWFAPLPHQVPDAENAWLYMLGLHAVSEENPIAFGSKRLAAYEERIARPGPIQDPDPTEKALDADPLPFVQKDESGHDLPYTCDSDKEDCVAWAAKNAEQLAELERANTLLMQRYDTLLGMTRFEDSSTPSIAEPLPGVTHEAALYRSLVWRDIADPARRPAALQRMVRAVEFAQRQGANATSLQMKIFSERTRERYMRVLDALIDRVGERGLDGLHDTIDVVLREPTAAQREWEPTLHREALRLATATAETIFPGPLDAWRYCTKACFTN